MPTCTLHKFLLKQLGGLGLYVGLEFISLIWEMRLNQAEVSWLHFHTIMISLCAW